MRLAAVFDWTGTLTTAREEAGNKWIGYALFNDAKQSGNIPRILRLVRAKYLTERRLEDYHKGRVPLQSVFETYNSGMAGLPVALIQEKAAQYARENAYQLDQRMLRPISRLRANGAQTGILSAAYDYVIKTTLEAAGYRDTFQHIIANTLEHENGRAIGLTLDAVYGHKAEIMEREFFRRRGFDPLHTFYAGDTMDDAPVADLLPPGHFIVPFLTPDDFRQHMASRYGAFVPENENDLEAYLSAHHMRQMSNDIGIATTAGLVNKS